LIPLATAGKTFLINLNNAPAGLAGKDCNPLFFSLAGLADTMHEMAGLYLQLQGYKSLVLAGPDNAVERVAAAAFRRSFKGRTVQVLSRHGEMNFEVDFRRIEQAAPDAVYLLHTGGMAVNFIRQFAESGLKEQLPLFGPGTTFDQTVLAASGAAALDSFSVAPWSEDLDSPSNRRMLADFEAEYGRPPSYYAAVGYDAAMLLDAALKAVDKRFNDEDALQAALRHAEFPSTRGSFRFDTNHFPILSYMVRQVVSDPRERMVNEQRGLLAKDVRDGHAGECPMRWAVEPPPKG
jgi:branched-chain amino acid transport system substrate-binding protein